MPQDPSTSLRSAQNETHEQGRWHYSSAMEFYTFSGKSLECYCWETSSSARLGTINAGQKSGPTHRRDRRYADCCERVRLGCGGRIDFSKTSQRDRSRGRSCTPCERVR